MHTYTKSCKLYQKGLSEFTDFISIRITFISSYYVQYMQLVYVTSTCQYRRGDCWIYCFVKYASYACITLIS